MSRKKFWKLFWSKYADKPSDELPDFFFEIRGLWKKHRKSKSSYHEHKIKDTVYCVRGICEGEKEINKTIEKIAIRNTEK